MKKSELKKLIKEVLEEGALVDSFTFQVTGNITVGNGAASVNEAKDMVFEKLKGIFDSDPEINIIE